jgi:hypothetical protein
MRWYRTPTRAVILASVIALAGCAPSLADARRAVNAASELYDATEEPLVKRYEAEQLSCIEREHPADLCVAEVRSRWMPVRAAAEAFYQALLAAQAAVGAAETGAALGRSTSIEQVLGVVLQAVDAAEALRLTVVAATQVRSR